MTAGGGVPDRGEGDVADVAIVSVDDHVLEPPDLWTSRASSRHRDLVPRVERARAVPTNDGKQTLVRSDDEGEPCDWWVYESLQIPLVTAAAAVGFEVPDITPTTFDAVHDGCWRQDGRLRDMTLDGVEASLCFPNVVPRFCGQTFKEARDKEVALECVRAYNDWLLEDWCAGPGRGRLIPLTIIPLWDLDLAVAELRRCADKGTVAFAFSENPHQLGLPSIHSGTWDPLFRTAAEADLMTCMHIGSSSHVPTTSPDAPHIISTITHFSVTMGSLLDFVFSGTLDRVPGLKLFYAESQAGWLPYVLEQADWLWDRREGSSLGSELPAPPSTYIDGRVFTSVYNDNFAMANRGRIGASQMCFECDFPHSVTSFPNSRDLALQHCRDAGMSEAEIHAFLRGNAITGFGLDRLGLAA
ncbi:MAG TPA: amidohydrolase family protein [Acidimicrobiales bacterium]|nr:amidohydrolase family protein [Acidimicrobiales bacterium]